MAEKLPFGEGASINRPPLFCGLNYQFWKVRMKIFVEFLDKGIWDAIENGPFIPKLVILPVDQSARVLPRQRYLPLDRTTLASVLHTSILLKNLQKTEWHRYGRSRPDAQVSDGITKILREKS